MTRTLLLSLLLLVLLRASAQENGVHHCNAHCLPLQQQSAQFRVSPASSIVHQGGESAGQTCPPNIDYEWGDFTNWQTNIGTVDTIINLTDTFNIIDLPASTWLFNANTPPFPQRQVLMDRNLNGIDYYGQFPVNPQGRGGRYSLKLGSDEDASDAPQHGLPNKKAESARYIITVPNPATDYSITFSYAVVLENPDGTSAGGGTQNVSIHQNFAQPRFRVKMYDAVTGELVPCANFNFVADEQLPGFFNSIHSYEHRSDAAVKCKDWTDVFVNLSRYAGRTLYLEFTTADCTYGGHFGYAYVDVVECGLNASGVYNCRDHSGVMTGPPGFQHYAWYNNDYSASVGAGQNVTIPNAVPGANYWCVVTPYNNTGCTSCTCKDTLGVKVVASFPVANAGNPGSICRYDSLSIGSAAVPGYSYAWSPTAGLSNANISSPLASPSSATDYILTVNDTLSHCETHDTVNVSIYVRPQPAFVVDDNTQCISGNSFVFTNNSSISSGTLQYHWSFGDGTYSTAMQVSHTYAQAGTYTVKLVTTSDHGCIDSTSHIVFVYAKPSAAFGVQGNNVCLSGNQLSFQLNQNVPGSTYEWNFGDGQIQTGAYSVQHSYQQAGSYHATVTVINAFGCVDSAAVQATIHAQPLLQLNSAQPPVICMGDSVKLVAVYAAGEGNVSGHAWYHDGALMTGLTDSVIFVHLAGSYVFNVVNNFGCSIADTINVTVNALPTGDLQAPSTTNICEGGQLTLTASGGTYYQWFLNGQPIAGANAAVYQATTAGLYAVDIFNQSGCHIRSAHPVQLNMIYPPQAAFALSATCVNVPLIFQNQSVVNLSGTVGYQWSVPGLFSSQLVNPSYHFTAPGDYQIQLVVASQTCPNLTDTLRQTITIFANPGGIRYPPVDVVKYRNQQLNARDLGSSFQWSPGNGLNATNRKDPIFNYNRDVEYLIRLMDLHGCPVVDTQLVRVFGKGDIYVPNAFTPDRSGNANDYMYPILVGMIELKYFRIFDRWGRLMFETSKPRPGWNGIFNNKPQPMDTYTWTVEAVDIDGRVITRSGNCVLIR